MQVGAHIALAGGAGAVLAEVLGLDSSAQPGGRQPAAWVQEPAVLAAVTTAR